MTDLYAKWCAKSCREGLLDAGSRRARAEHDRADALAELAYWVREAKREGMPVVEIARLAGLSRMTVYAMLDG